MSDKQVGDLHIITHFILRSEINPGRWIGRRGATDWPH